jgi:F-type H+-transporting ATPase subunit epsilon
MATAATRAAGGGGTGGPLRVNVVTPRGPVAREETDGVTAPGQLGELEVLPGHVPFLTELHPGVLVLGDKRARKVLAVGPGFLSVDPAGEIQVLVEQAVLAEEADLEGARAVVAELGPKIREWKLDLGAEYRNVKARLDWAQAQLDAHARIR